MPSLRFILGLLPVTAKYESLTDQLRKDYVEYKEFETSDDLKHYEALEKEVNSSDFLLKVKNIKSLKYRSSAEFSQEQEYLKLQKSKSYQKYQKLQVLKPAMDTSDYQDLMRLKDSYEVKRINELESIIKTDKFQESKRYLSMSSKDRFEKSEEYKKQNEYNQLKKSAKIIWYKNIKKKYPFTEIEKWNLVFEDKFDSGNLDKKIWMGRYLYGDKILKSGYVLADDKHAFTEGNNIEIFDKKLRIITRREKSKSLVWHPSLGFYEKEFDFTSDLISSAKSFKCKYGIFEAKVRIANSGVTQAFSLMSDQMLPHIDILRFEKGKLTACNFWNNGSGTNKSVSSAGGIKFTKDFFIYSLEWLPGILIWRINGVIFKKMTTGIPEKEMFIVFNSSLKDKANETGVPSSLEIDWIRAYKRKE